MKRRAWMGWIFGLTLLLGGGWYGMRGLKDPSPSGKEQEHGEHQEHEEHGEEGHVKLSPEALEHSGIETGRAGPGELTETVSLPGEVGLNEDRVAHVVPRFPGVVKEVHKQLGDHVKAGEVLAVVQSNESLAPYEIASLIDGTVVQKHVAKGEFVREDQQIYVIADLSTVWINVTVYTHDLARIKEGQRVKVFSNELEQEVMGTINYLHPLVGEPTRAAVARVVLENPERAWRPGLFVTAKVILREQTVPLAVPETAVQTVEGQPVVFVREKNTFEMRQITRGRSDGTLTEVREGLRPGERIVVKGSFILKSELQKGEAGHDH